MLSCTCQPVLVSLQLLLSDVRAGRSRAHASASTATARRLAPQRSQQLDGVAASARTATVAAAAATARRRRVFVRRCVPTRLPVSHSPALQSSSNEYRTCTCMFCVAVDRPHLRRHCRHRRRRRLRTATRSSSASTSAATPSPTASPSTPRPTCSPSASSRRSSPSAATSGESLVLSRCQLPLQQLGVLLRASQFSHHQRRQLSRIVCRELLLCRLSHRFLTRRRTCCCVSRSARTEEFQTRERH